MSSSEKKSHNQISSTHVPDELSPDNLCRLCDPTSLGFDTTDELPGLEDVIGQPRAFKALTLGSEVSGQGYNIFVVGVPGSGRTTLSREFLERKAILKSIPDDWCYVHNFDNPHQPKALRLPPGHAEAFRTDLQTLISRCRQEIIRVFSSEEFIKERDLLNNSLKKNQEAEISKLQSQVEKFNFVIGRTPFGFVLVPTIEGKPLKPEDIEKLSEEQRTKFEQLQANLEEDVKKTLSKMREMEKSTYDKIQKLNERTTLFVVEYLVDDLKKKYIGFEQVVVHLDAIEKDIVVNVEKFHSEEEGKQPEIGGKDWFQRYEVNVFVDNSETKGAPIIVESHPTYHNLLGRIEHEVVMGASRTDFTMIRPGALHRANGGYLILPAREVLRNPYAWEGLERTLRDGIIRILELGAQLSLLSTTTLEPEPINLYTKVVLIGTPMLYYLLRAYDEDFAKLFKVRAEFATLMARTAETEKEYSLYVKSVVDDCDLLPFDNTAIARIIEHGSRLARDQMKLSTRFGMIADLIRESAYWANKENMESVTVTAVNHAIDENIYRNNLIEERIHELIAQDTLIIDVAGQAVGQVNALSIMMLGDYSFGRPNRVTAVVHPGRGHIVDIERQAKLGGSVHTKGVLIISGLLGNRYGHLGPLSLSASLTFEQSYEEVEGDSASVAELFALLSAIADIPLRQDISVTGSVNQLEQIQAVGGLNEKIEGFFTACKMKGLTSTQGVIIPSANVRNLMLKKEVVHAVENGQFHVWSIANIDEGLSLLTGLEPGELKEDGTYPEGTFNAAVQNRLDRFTKAMKAASRPETKNDKHEETADEEKEE